LLEQLPQQHAPDDNAVDGHRTHWIGPRMFRIHATLIKSPFEPKLTSSRPLSNWPALPRSSQTRTPLVRCGGICPS
jgi:hypothetical protein